MKVRAPQPHPAHSNIISSINPGFVIRHRLGFTGLAQAMTNEHISILNALTGMLPISISPKKPDLLTLKYDASKCQIDDILSLLASWGAHPRTTWWNNIKLSWARQTDQNIFDTARHMPHCCSKPPNGK